VAEKGEGKKEKGYVIGPRVCASTDAKRRKSPSVHKPPPTISEKKGGEKTRLHGYYTLGFHCIRGEKFYFLSQRGRKGSNFYL